MGIEYRTPTKTTTPVANTTAGLWTFGTKASTLLLTNQSGQTISVRFNSVSAASATAYDVIMVNGACTLFEASDYGVHDWSTVGVWFPTSATVTSFVIRGI
jgi:hypothetical protein